jgi:hypothetical protein
MLLAFLHWLANGEAVLHIAVSADEDLILALPPAQWTAPVSIPLTGDDEEPDEDDPSIEDVDEYEIEEDDEAQGAT